MKKVLIVLVASCLLLGGCSEDFEKIEGNKSNEVQVYVDPETGVNYLIYRGGYKGGITVRYNADGTVMVTEVEN